MGRVRSFLVWRKGNNVWFLFPQNPSEYSKLILNGEQQSLRFTLQHQGLSLPFNYTMKEKSVYSLIVFEAEGSLSSHLVSVGVKCKYSINSMAVVIQWGNRLINLFTQCNVCLIALRWSKPDFLASGIGSAHISAGWLIEVLWHLRDSGHTLIQWMLHWESRVVPARQQSSRKLRKQRARDFPWRWFYKAKMLKRL